MGLLEAKDELIYVWNTQGIPERPKNLLLDDETLLDGLQSRSVSDPRTEDKSLLLPYMAGFGIDNADIRLPGAGTRAAADVEALAREIATAKLKIKANCAARTVVNDIKPVAEISQKTGVPIEVFCFLGSSPIRQFTENWTIDVL